MNTERNSGSLSTVTLPPDLPALTLGWEAVRWATKYLRHPNGPRAGQRWEFTESQLRFVLLWYGVDEDGRFIYRHAARRLAKGSGKSPFAAVIALIELLAPVRLSHFDPDAPGGCVGKPVDMPLVQIAATAESQTANTMRMVRALAPKGSRVVRDYGLDVGKTMIYAPGGGMLQIITSSATAAEGAEVTFVVADEALSLDTPIPTPDGWTTVGDVAPGDTIIGATGEAVRVTHTTPVFEGRPCYRVTFADGTHLDADEGHLWASEIVGSAALPKVRTTREMYEDGRRFAVPRMAPFAGSPVESPVDPYLLGLWLGDGSARWASLTVGDEDIAHVMEQAATRGVPSVTSRKYSGSAWTVSLRGNSHGDLYTKDGSSFRAGLVALGVLGNKHVPARLLRGSVAQRLDLLRGLMDSDGWTHKSNGSAVFVNSNPRLIEGVLELVRSFGWDALVTSRADSRWQGRPVTYKVSFRPDSDNNPFLLPRKAARVRAASARRHKTIRSIERINSVPVKCIEVDAPDHLFVAGSGWTVTHNTEHWTPSTGGPELSQTLDRNLRKSGSRMMETSNAWAPGIGSVAEATWDAYVAQCEGRSRGKSQILYDSRSAPPDTDLADEASLTAAIEHVYGDCFWVDVETIREAIYDPRTPVDVSRRYYLNQPTASVDAWVTPQQWAACAKPEVKVEAGEQIAMFFDGSKSSDATALMGCRLSDGHVFTLGVWEVEPGELVPVADVDGTVLWARDTYDVRGFYADVREWESFAKVSWPAEFEADKLTVWAEPQGSKYPELIAWDMRIHTADFTRAAELCAAEIEDGTLTHDGDSRVARHVGNARRRPNRFGVSVGKESRGSALKIDAAICVIGARMVRRRVLAAGVKPTKQRTGRVVGF